MTEYFIREKTGQRVGLYNGWQGYLVDGQKLVEPRPKIVDLSVVAGKRIPMQVQTAFSGGWANVLLEEVGGYPEHPYKAKGLGWYEKCRFDTSPDAWVYHDGGECPLPDGVMVEVVFANRRKLSDSVDNIPWRDDFEILNVIVAYRVTGLVDGWGYTNG